MIEGVTKPFEYGRTVDLEVRLVATGMYIAGMRGLFEQFDPQTNGSHLLNLEVPAEGGGLPLPITAERRLHSILATSDQMHSWMIDRDGLVERSDSPLLGKREPEREQMVSFEAPLPEVVAALKQVAAEREALGMSRQSVDIEEVTGLFSLLGRARLVEWE